MVVPHASSSNVPGDRVDDHEVNFGMTLEVVLQGLEMGE